MNEIDYTQLDKEIIKSVLNFPGGNFQNIYAGRVAKEAQQIDATKPDKLAYMRVKDLEKRGVIYQKSRLWYPSL